MSRFAARVGHLGVDFIEENLVSGSPCGGTSFPSSSLEYGLRPEVLGAVSEDLQVSLGEDQVVPAAGIEPARPKSGEFKSPVSTIPPRGPRAGSCLGGAVRRVCATCIRRRCPDSGEGITADRTRGPCHVFAAAEPCGGS